MRRAKFCFFFIHWERQKKVSHNTDSPFPKATPSNRWKILVTCHVISMCMKNEWFLRGQPPPPWWTTGTERRSVSLTEPRVVTVRGQLGRCGTETGERHKRERSANPSLRAMSVYFLRGEKAFGSFGEVGQTSRGWEKQRPAPTIHIAAQVDCVSWKNVDFYMPAWREEEPTVILLCNVMVQGPRTHL